MKAPGKTFRFILFAGAAFLSPCAPWESAAHARTENAAPMSFPAPVQDAGTARWFEALRAADLELAMIGYRLATANAPLCRRLEPGTGIRFQTLDQFLDTQREAARRHFGFAGEVAVEAVVPDSPADRAGLRADDTILHFGPIDMADLQGAPGTTDRLVAVEQAVAALPPDRPIQIRALRGGAPVALTLNPVPACRGRVELRLANDFDAVSDGVMVQVSVRLLEDYPADFVAAVMAHEYAHLLLGHAARMRAQGVDFGILSGFGRNVRYFRQTETEADILSVAVLVNAGYPADLPVRFWNVFGPEHADGAVTLRTYPAWRDRVATMAHEAARIGRDPVLPVVPPILSARERPLDGDWRTLLVRARR